MEKTIRRDYLYKGVVLTKLCYVRSDYFPWSWVVKGSVLVGRNKKDITEQVDLLLEVD